MTNPVDAQKNSYPKVIRWLSNPYLGAIGTIASVIGIPLAIYLYIQSIQTPELTVYFDPGRAQIYRANQTSRLKISHDDQLVQNDISAVQLALWNNGKKSIRGGNVLDGGNILEPVVIYTKNNVPILEASIRKQSRSVVKISLDQSSISQGKLGVSWNILEPNDGAVVQIIYVGTPDMDFTIAGIIEGQDIIRKFEPSLSTNNTANSRILARFVAYVLMGMGILTSILDLFVSGRRNTSRSPLRNTLVILSLIYVVGGLIFLLSLPPEPPFGF